LQAVENAAAYLEDLAEDSIIDDLQLTESGAADTFVAVSAL
jgi:hypothetical protein